LNFYLRRVLRIFIAKLLHIITGISVLSYILYGWKYRMQAKLLIVVLFCFSYYNAVSGSCEMSAPIIETLSKKFNILIIIFSFVSGDMFGTVIVAILWLISI